MRAQTVPAVAHAASRRRREGVVLAAGVQVVESGLRQADGEAPIARGREHPPRVKYVHHGCIVSMRAAACIHLAWFIHGIYIYIYYG